MQAMTPSAAGLLAATSLQRQPEAAGDTGHDEEVVRGLDRPEARSWSGVAVYD
jgi:hypothetical protein